MFGSLKALPADPILGLLAKYREDVNPQKIDLGVGVYKKSIWVLVFTKTKQVTPQC